MTTQFTVSKTNVECYKLRHESGLYWADITIDDEGESGRIQVASDFGDFQHYWRECGKPFKEFLIKIGIDYAASKFRQDDWFDYDGTINRYKSSIIVARMQEHLDYKEARKMYDEIKEIENECSHFEDQFIAAICEKKTLMSYFDHCPELSRDISPQFKRFWKMVWPVFIEELKKELTLTTVK